MRQLKISKQVTNREFASLDKYLQEISKEELLTADEEVALAKKIKEGDKMALEKLIKANLRFVVSVSKQYQNQGLQLPDLINEGNIGLVRAAQRFDETRGFKFISYAVWWIRQSILQGIAEKSRTVRLPLNKIGILNKLNKIFSELEQNFQREPTAEELALFSDLKLSEVEQALIHKTRTRSMDEAFNSNEDDSGNMYDVMEDMNESATTDSHLINESRKREIERCLSTLRGKEADIVRYYFGLSGQAEMTLEEIGERFGLTRERVRQIKDQAIRRLKHTNRSRLLKTYLA